LSVVADVLVQNNSANSVIFAGSLDQTAGNYQSADLRTDRVHGILTYYFTRALQSGITDIPGIYQYLQRNMTFTSRRLHNRAQDPFALYNEPTNLLRFTPDF